MTPRRARAVARLQSRLARGAADGPRTTPRPEARGRKPGPQHPEASVLSPIPPDIAERLRAGKLEQACPDCGVWEAAGSYCTGCYRPMGPDDWYPNGDEKRRRVAHERAAEKAQTRVKRAPGRPRRHVDDPAPLMASPAFSPEAGFWPA